MFLDAISQVNPDSCYPTGYEDCIIGMLSSIDPVIVMDKNKMINKLVMEGMTEEEAIEYFDYNIGDAYIENGPVYFVSVDDVNKGEI